MPASRRSEGSWPDQPAALPNVERLRLDSIGFDVPLSMVYEGTALVDQPAPG
jgi:hypothetical protein